MAGSSSKRERRVRWLALKADPGFAQDCISRIACGDSIRALAAENDIPINTFWHWVTKEHGEDVAAARKVVAAQLADQMKEAAERVEAGELNPKAAQTASSIRQWLAARYDRDTFGDKSRLDLNVTNVQQLHLEAIRQISLEDEHCASSSLIGECSEVLEPEKQEGSEQGGEILGSDNRHPLL